VTQKPNVVWVGQQLREAWAYKQPHRFLLFDRDAKFGVDVISVVRDMGSQPTRTAFRSPWQNGVAERWVGSCRRDLLEHVIVLNERHLKRLMGEYVRYYHEDRTHLGLQGHASRSANSNPLRGWKRDSILAETRRPAPSLCSSGVDSRTILPTTKLFPFFQGRGAAFVRPHSLRATPATPD
jgi:hypothetical protein